MTNQLNQERTVAEIIGWSHEFHEADSIDDDYCSKCGLYRFGDVACEPYRWRPTVDDLLAWILEGRAETVDVHGYELPDERGVRYVVSWQDDDESWSVTDATVLAALEAAVRRIAG